MIISRMKSKIFLLVALVIGFLGVFAVCSRAVLAETPSPVVSAVSAEVNSFEAFWPLVAGKTEGDSLYFLKQLKEQVRGLLIFGTPQKLEYNVLLAAKRSLEAEKLIQNGNSDAAKRTLERAQAQLNNAEKNIDSAKSSNQSLSKVSGYVGSRLSNIEKLTLWLAAKDSNLKEILTEIGNKAGSLSSKL